MEWLVVEMEYFDFLRFFVFAQEKKRVSIKKWDVWCDNQTWNNRNIFLLPKAMLRFLPKKSVLIKQNDNSNLNWTRFWFVQNLFNFFLVSSHMWTNIFSATHTEDGLDLETFDCLHPVCHLNRTGMTSHKCLYNKQT